MIVWGVFVAGFLVAFSFKPGQVAAENTKAKALRDGHEILFLHPSPSAPPQSVKIPVGVVLTDLILDVTGSTNLITHCKVWLKGVNPLIRDGQEIYFELLPPLEDLPTGYERAWEPAAERRDASALE